MIKKLHIIEAETWKADGGACFGVVPKTLWMKFVQPDENNMITLSNRLLLVETDNRNILINTGMGKKRDVKFYQFKYVSGWNNMILSLEKAGFSPLDITDVIFTHLHDDHCGGAVSFDEIKQEYHMVFPEATHWCSKTQYDNMLKPNPREKASYFPDNLQEINDCGKLKFFKNNSLFCEGIELRIFDGHTFGQVTPLIQFKDKIVVYTSDFIPSAAHIPLPFIPAYDIQPLLAMKEKEVFLEEAVVNKYILFFEHDYENFSCSVKHTDKGFKMDAANIYW